MRQQITVNAIWDSEAKVWFTQSPDVIGLHCEADTIPELLQTIFEVLPDLIQQNKPELLQNDTVPFVFNAPMSTHDNHCH